MPAIEGVLKPFIHCGDLLKIIKHNSARKLLEKDLQQKFSTRQWGQTTQRTTVVIPGENLKASLQAFHFHKISWMSLIARCRELATNEKNLRLELSASTFLTWMADCCSMNGSVVITIILSPSEKLTALAGDSKLNECNRAPVSQSHSLTDWSAELVTRRDESPEPQTKLVNQHVYMTPKKRP